MNLVTVIMPHHDMWHLMEEPLLSVLAQTVPCNIIVVDDFSLAEFGCLKIRRFWEDESIEWLRTPCKVDWAKTIQVGIDACQTDWFFLLNGDDTIDPLCIEKCLAAAERTGYQIAVPRGTYEGVPPSNVAVSNPYWYAALFHKAAWARMGGYRDTPLADWDFWIRCRIKKEPIAQCGEQLFYWNDRPDGMSRKLIASGEMEREIRAMKARYSDVAEEKD